MYCIHCILSINPLTPRPAKPAPLIFYCLTPDNFNLLRESVLRGKGLTVNSFNNNCFLSCISDYLLLLLY